MDGFADGVAHYNQVKGKTVQVLGWDKAKQNGLFANSFTDQAKGKTLAQTLNSQGADVIMPVAGGTGLGTAAAAQASGGKFSVIWVDQDGCVSAAQLLHRVPEHRAEEHRGRGRGRRAQADAGGTLTGGGSIGTLANNGVRARAVPRLRQQGPGRPARPRSTSSRPTSSAARSRSRRRRARSKRRPTPL